jgi:DeoR family transcriptional regulator of aga operon
MLNEKGEISVQFLKDYFKVSDVSIRNDLANLEKKGLLIRNHGGAIKNQLISFDLNLNERIKKNQKEKNKIGKYAAKFVKDGNTIIMDSGSTTIEVAKHLTDKKDLKVITNSLPIAYILADNQGIEVVMPGGVLRGQMKSLKGSLTENNIRSFNCDIAFIGVDAIDASKGLFTPSIAEASLSNSMINIARQVIVVADSSKFYKKSFVKINDIKAIDILVTDKNVKDEFIQEIEAQGARVVSV